MTRRDKPQKFHYQPRILSHQLAIVDISSPVVEVTIPSLWLQDFLKSGSWENQPTLAETSPPLPHQRKNGSWKRYPHPQRGSRALKMDPRGKWAQASPLISNLRFWKR